MRKVGLRDLKNQLSRYVRRVRAGHGVLVTDRGQVVAELLPPGSSAATGRDSGLAALARRGVLVLGAPNDPALYPTLPRLLPDGAVERLLDQERGER